MCNQKTYKQRSSDEAEQSKRETIFVGKEKIEIINVIIISKNRKKQDTFS